MPSQEDIAGQQRLLQLYRRTLQIYLEQQAKFGEVFVPPHLIHGIDDARAHIQRIKSNLRAWEIPFEDHPDDQATSDKSISIEPTTSVLEPTKEQPARTLPHDSGGYLLELPDYQYYYPQAQTQKIIQDIFAHPGYHLVEAAIGMGKTALISYLWKNQVPIRPVVLQLF